MSAPDPTSSAAASSPAPELHGSTPVTAPEKAHDYLRLGLPILLVAVIVLAPLLGTRRGIRDGDTFWHIRAGADLLKNGQFVVDDTSSAFGSHPWILHEWAPEVAFAISDQVAGLAGVAWLWHVAIMALIVSLVVICSRVAQPLAASLGVAAAFLGTTGSLSPRPQMVSFILLAVTVGAWLSTTSDRRPRWWLVAVSWVWACSHGLWVVGPVVGAAVVLGMALDARGRTDVLARREWLRLAAVPVLCGLVGLVTPVGPRLVLAPFEVSQITGLITEWGPSALSALYYSVTLAALGVVAAVWALRARAVPASRVLLWLLAAFFTVYAGRTVALAAVIAGPLLAEALDQLLPARPERRSRRTLVGCTVVAAVVSSLVATLTVSGRVVDQPTGLSPQLQALPAGTVVFDDYAYGGWLYWAFPRLRTTVDGRTEIFSYDYLSRQVAAQQAVPGWQDTVARSGATYALLPRASPLGDVLVNELHWSVVGSADDIRLLAAPGSAGG